MDSFNYEDDISILTQNGQQDDTEWADAPNTDLTGEEYTASHYALITAYNDIKQRLIGMERDNSTLKRKLRQYDLKFSLSNELVDDKKLPQSLLDITLLRNENTRLREQLEHFRNQLRDCKEREDHLDEVIKAYEKIRSEKDDLHQQLEEMTVLAEDHISTIQSLEQALRLRDSSVQILNDQLQAKNEQIIQLSPTRRSPYVAGVESPRHQQNCRVVDPQLDELEVQRLQEKVDELQRKLHSCQWRERQYKEECDRLQSQLSQQSLQESCAQEPSHDPHDMEWIKNTEEEQENLVLAYTELAQELCQLRSLTEAQTEILRRLSEEQLTNNAHLQPSGHVRQVAYSSYPRSTSHRLRTNFQGRRSYSEVSDVKVESHTMPSRLPADDQTSPTHRQYLANDYLKVPDSPDIGPFERQIESEDEDWMNHSPPGTLDRGIRSTSSCTALPIPDTTMNRSSTEYSRSEHAQSWPSINLWMETGDSDIRSCPLCQLAFPLNYPDDALIKHIDTHLENSKI
ncbi:TANK-binding kinase 1-binding protein 1-like isoform X1 [Chiloscyllium punctatum]|uniref:TANK-binding kinase 1-binding protein 1-like isoform X1 n=1 Tax=Chiloscyllium punctatum TaxID=137246 RepID=UPI003B63902A